MAGDACAHVLAVGMNTFQHGDSDSEEIRLLESTEIMRIFEKQKRTDAAESATLEIMLELMTAATSQLDDGGTLPFTPQYVVRAFLLHGSAN